MIVVVKLFLFGALFSRWLFSIFVLISRFIDDSNKPWAEKEFVALLFFVIFISIFLVDDIKTNNCGNQERNGSPSEKRIEKIETKDFPFIKVKYCDNNWWCIIKKETNDKEKN